MKTTIDLKLILLPLGFLLHGIIISISGFLLLFCNDVSTIAFVTFLVLLVFIQTLVYGCILNKLEDDRTMSFLIDILKKCITIKSRKEQLIDDLPKMLVGMTLAAYILKLNILLLFSYQNIKFIEAGMISFIFFKFDDSLKKFKYVYNQIVGN